MPQLFVLNVLDVMWSTGQNHVYASCCAWYTPAVACGSTYTTYQPSTGICYNQGKHRTAMLAHSSKFLLPCALPCCWASYNQSLYRNCIFCTGVVSFKVARVTCRYGTGTVAHGSYPLPSRACFIRTMRHGTRNASAIGLALHSICNAR